jgi:hypothetical protein
MAREAPERFGQGLVAQAGGQCLEAGRRCFIQLFLRGFRRFGRRRAGLHAHPYSSKFPPLPGKFVQDIGRTLPQQCRRRTAGSHKLELLGSGIRDTEVGGQCGRQRPVQSQLQAELTLPAPLEIGQRSVVLEYLP